MLPKGLYNHTKFATYFLNMGLILPPLLNNVKKNCGSGEGGHPLTNSALLATCVCCKFQFGTFRLREVLPPLDFGKQLFVIFLDAYCHLSHEIFRRSPPCFSVSPPPSVFWLNPGPHLRLGK